MILSWSGGKDSALALWYLQKSDHHVSRLLTTVNRQNDRIVMHGVRRSLLEKQAESIGLPLDIIYLDQNDNSHYEERLKTYLLQVHAQGTDAVAFGDIFLDSLRTYREQQLKKIGMEGIFPLWHEDTRALLETFIGNGFESILCATNKEKMGKVRPGIPIDRNFRKQLPKGVDPCGENGEYHSFCHKGPVFQTEILFEKGRVQEVEYDNGGAKTTIQFLDLLPA